MFVRFTTLQQDENSHSLKGIFQAAFDLRDSACLAEYEEKQVIEALDWLKMHLQIA